MAENINPIGRPTKYTPECVNRILKAIEECMPYASAAAIGGISEATFYQWKNDFIEFSEAIKEASAKAEQGLVDTIRTDESWQSKAWILERRHPDNWGKIDRVKTEISGPDGAPLTLNLIRTDFKQKSDE